MSFSVTLYSTFFLSFLTGSLWSENNSNPSRVHFKLPTRIPVRTSRVRKYFSSSFQVRWSVRTDTWTRKIILVYLPGPDPPSPFLVRLEILVQVESGMGEIQGSDWPMGLDLD